VREELAEGPSPGMEEGEFRERTMCNKPYIGIPQGVYRELGYQANLSAVVPRPGLKFSGKWQKEKVLILSLPILAKCQLWQQHSQT
jgi:hypothetical protein